MTYQTQNSKLGTYHSPLPPRVIVISGPSGVGKSTICRRLCELLPADWSVSVTTRPPRGGEVDGEAYHFISREEYNGLLATNGLLEHAEVHGNGYGTPADPVRKSLADGRSIVLEIDVKGAEQVKEKLPDGLFFFILPPSYEELERRIRGRKTDSDEVIARRLAFSSGEIAAARKCGVYTHFVVNDDLTTTENKILDLIRKEN